MGSTAGGGSARQQFVQVQWPRRNAHAERRDSQRRKAEQLRRALVAVATSRMLSHKVTKPKTQEAEAP